MSRHVEQEGSQITLFPRGGMAVMLRSGCRTGEMEGFGFSVDTPTTTKPVTFDTERQCFVGVFAGGCVTVEEAARLRDWLTEQIEASRNWPQPRFTRPTDG